MAQSQSLVAHMMGGLDKLKTYDETISNQVK